MTMKHSYFMQAINEFDIPGTALAQAAACVRYDIEQGLSGNPSSLKMLRSYIGLPTGNETGEYLALDFGGTNLRAALVHLDGNGNFKISKKVAKPLKFSGLYDFIGSGSKGSELFDFIASVIDEAIDGDRKKKYYLGHTFSFPSRQTNIYNSSLMTWTKEFATRDVEGKIVNDLLKEALQRQNIGNVEPVAVINDTVAVLLSAAYKSADTYIGSIYATGHNTCYFERSTDSIPSPMILNLEIGNFDKLSVNKYDSHLAAASEYPYQQRLEKMVSGRYLGKLFSYCVQDIYDMHTLPAFISEDLSFVLNVSDTDFSPVVKLFKARSNIDLSLEDALFIQKLAASIVNRSARLTAATYCGILWHIFPDTLPPHKIVIDGSLFEKMPGVEGSMYKALNEVLGADAAGITLAAENGGSILGAAIAAAMSKKRQ
ncbi:hexokinase family protein [Pectinatus haikarae]|uniref:hexokinase n=1 Tax=Pectinatus haikarae TaxID=349096 RepID=UPI0038B2557B